MTKPPEITFSVRESDRLLPAGSSARSRWSGRAGWLLLALLAFLWLHGVLVVVGLAGYFS